MNFSTKGRYGLRAMIDLAVHSEEAVPISSIAARENISECYLEQLAAKLKKSRSGGEHKRSPGRLPAGKAIQ